MARVYISIGGNVDPHYHVTASLTELEQSFGPLTLSTIYRNRAVGFEGDDFLNLVAGFDTGRGVRDVAAELHRIEDAHGRRRDAPRFSPRTLDLDLLLYDQQVLDEPGVRIPRKDIIRYAFMLCPLAEIAGERRHPVLGQTFAELWAAFDKTGVELVPVSLGRD